MLGLHGVKFDVFGEGPISLKRRARKSGAAILGSLSVGTYRIRIMVPPGRGTYHAFTVQGNGNCQMMATIDSDSSENKGGSTFLKKVTVKSGDNTYPYTLPSSNNLRLLRTKRGGNIELWEIALVGQNGNFFLSVRKYFEGCCYNRANVIICPGLERWPQIFRLLNEVLGSKMNSLPLFTEEPPKLEEPNSNGLGDNEGLVLWYAPFMGVGAVLTNRGQARVHWRQIKDSDEFACLDEGDMVEFGCIDSPVVRAGQRPTTFKLEVRNVVRTVRPKERSF